MYSPCFGVISYASGSGLYERPPLKNSGARFFIRVSASAFETKTIDLTSWFAFGSNSRPIALICRGVASSLK
jgi:hypothetical protein